MKPRKVTPADTRDRGWLAFWVCWWLALMGFVVLASFAAAFDYFPGDRGLTDAIQKGDARAWREALDWASRLSEWPAMVIVGFAGAVTLWLLAHRSEAVWLLATLALTQLNGAVKLAVDRPRPSPEFVDVREVATGLSFPSGHTVTAVLLYGFLFYAAGQALPDRRLRYPVQALCVIIAGLMLALLIWSHRRGRARWPAF